MQDKVNYDVDVLDYYEFRLQASVGWFRIKYVNHYTNHYVWATEKLKDKTWQRYVLLFNEILPERH